MNRPTVTHPTDRQLEVLRAISRASARGYGPTVRELGTELGIVSTNGVADHLEALERKGLVQSAVNKARTIRLTPAGVKWVQS